MTVNGEAPRNIPKIIAPTEEGWPENPYKCRRLDGIMECKCLITADNADPIEVDVVIDVSSKTIKLLYPFPNGSFRN
ncbi:MAG: hypothetical protein ACXQTS_04970 [Candidatus Methanospirareceae archaeon]